MGWSLALSHPGCLRSLKDSSVLTQEGQSGGRSAGQSQTSRPAMIITQARAVQYVDDSDEKSKSVTDVNMRMCFLSSRTVESLKDVDKTSCLIIAEPPRGWRLRPAAN